MRPILAASALIALSAVTHASDWKIIADDPIAFLRSDDGKHWIDATPPGFAEILEPKDVVFRDQLVSVSALDDQRAWAAVLDGDHVRFAFTKDGGGHWSSVDPIIPDLRASAVGISFVSERDGFLLASGDPAAGIMLKNVYRTTDGARTWTKMADPVVHPMSYYTTGISFRTPLEGWVTGTYHGAPDVPLLRTTDGGKTWKVQPLPIPENFQGGYGDVSPPVFDVADRKRGRLPVKLVRHTPAPDHTAWVNFETSDGGATWQLSAYDKRESWPAPKSSYELRYNEGRSFAEPGHPLAPGKFMIVANDNTVWSWARWTDNSANSVDSLWTDDGNAALILDRPSRADTGIYLLNVMPAVQSRVVPLGELQQKVLTESGDTGGRTVVKSWFGEWRFLRDRFVGLCFVEKNECHRLLLEVNPATAALRLLGQRVVDPVDEKAAALDESELKSP